MHSPVTFERICRAMSHPDFYPHPVIAIDRRDTHISTVFLTGDWAYKLKRPVDFGFLDFRTLQDRKRYCEQELRLNRRLSHDIYQDVVAIYRSADHAYSLRKTGEIAEYAVKMRQLPDTASLEHGLQNNRIHPDQMTALGKLLAGFYRRSDCGPDIDRYGRPELVAFNMEENFRQIDPFVAAALDREKWECVRQVSRSFLKDHLDLFIHRVKTRRIRDGHGDLRCDHVYFHEGIQIIDCIEFNDRFRYGDAALDLSFLHMDLEHLGYPELSRHFLNGYAASADDPGLYTLLDFYASYRAVVRLKINCLRLADTTEFDRPALQTDIRHYLDQAYQYAVRYSRPTLWIVFGMPATGKSTLAERLAAALAVPVLQSDRIRKKEPPSRKTTVVPFGQGLYRNEMRQRVYGRLFTGAQQWLKQGRSVVLDATFSHRKWRDQAQQLAGDLDTNIIFIECTCAPEIIRARLKQRENGSGISDARIEHFEDMAADFDGSGHLSADVHICTRGDQPPERTLIQVLSEGYGCKCAQINAILEHSAHT